MGDEALRIDGTSPEALRDEIERSGWAHGPVLRACVLRQGHSPTIASAILLYGLVRFFFSPGSRQLPRTFVLVATSDRVRAFRARGSVSAEGYRLIVFPGEEAGWPRDEVTLEPAGQGMTENALITVPGDDGPERIRCTVPNSSLAPALEGMEALLRPAATG